jgi:hypothetical protein
LRFVGVHPPRFAAEGGELSVFVVLALLFGLAVDGGEETG